MTLSCMIKSEITSGISAYDNLLNGAPSCLKNFSIYSSGYAGPNNDAFNDSSLKTDRDYQVRLNGVPEPAALSLLALGGLGLLRRRR